MAHIEQRTNKSGGQNMSEEKFSLVFTGQVISGFEYELAKQNIQRLFRIDDKKTEILFSGKAITLRKGLDSEAANKYRVAMKKAGTLVNVVLEQSEVVKDLKTASEASPKPDGQNRESNEGLKTLSTALGAQPEKQPQESVNIDAPEFALFDLGADLLEQHEKSQTPEADVDTSNYGLAEQHGNLVSEQELEKPTSQEEVKVPELDVAPVGSDVLLPDEKSKVVTANVDVSMISLAEPGSDIGDKKEVSSSPKVPNVDHLKLQ